MTKSIVSIAKGFDADRMVHEAVENLGGIGSFIRRGSTVVIKPNAGHEGAPETSVNNRSVSEHQGWRRIGSTVW